MRADMMVIVALLVGLTAGRYLAETSTSPTAAGGASHADIDGADNGFGANDGDDDEGAGRTRVVTADGETRIHLTTREVELSGIRTALPDVAESTSTVRYAGRVLAAGALLTEQARLRAMVSGINAQDRIIAVLNKRRAELTVGSRMGAQRDLAALELDLTRARGRAAVLKSERDAARTALEAEWGATLVARTAAPTGMAQALLAGSAVLIGVDLSPGAPAPKSGFTVTLAQHSLTATNIGPSPVALAGLPGRGWYALVDGLGTTTGDATLAAGMPVTVWSGDASSTSGVLIPDSAIVWDGDGRWVFLMPAPNEYVRRAIGNVIERPDGLLVTGISATTPVVIAGAQTLQGERFRDAIPDEDDA